MFLKRSLVMVVGVLLFIGAFLLKFRLSAAQLENMFKEERAKFGVEGVVLTIPEAAPPVEPAPAREAPPTPAPATSDAATSAVSDSSTVNSQPASANTGAGSSTDPTVIIGPMPPASTAPDSSEPPTAPAPGPDTNGGPMMPPSSGFYSPRQQSPIFVEASYRPSEMASQLAQVETGQASNPEATPAISSNASAGSRGTSAPVTSESGAVMAKTAPPSHAASAGGRAIVLGFHQFTAPGVPSRNIYSMRQDIFAGEMKYLRDNGYNVVPLSEVVGFIEHKNTLPPNAVAITIDDGYKSALNYAAPVLKEYGYPWTYFVYPAFITRTEGKGAASWPDLLELEKEGIDVESHSMTHPKLSSHRQYFTETPSAGGGAPVITYGRSLHVLSPQEYDDFLTNETTGAKQLLERELGKKIKYLAYPYGDYNKAVEAKAIAAGYEAIFTVAGNPVHVTTSLHSVGRYIITKPDEPHYTGFLHQGALSLTQADPSPGATVSNPRPLITAVLGFNSLAATLETEVNGFAVPHDFDPQTSTVRVYLKSDLVKPEVLVSIRAKDTQSGQTVVSNWHFNYEPSGSAAATPASVPAAAVKDESAPPPATSTTTPRPAAATNSPSNTGTNMPAAAPAQGAVTNP